MKKLLYSLILVFVIGCQKDGVKNGELDIKELAGYIGRSQEYVKKHFKGEFYADRGHGIAVEYIYKTKEAEYNVAFFMNRTDTVEYISILKLCEGSVNNYIKSFKQEMDRCEKAFGYGEYSGAYYIGHFTNIAKDCIFDEKDRKTFWKMMETLSVIGNSSGEFQISEKWKVNNLKTANGKKDSWDVGGSVFYVDEGYPPQILFGISKSL